MMHGSVGIARAINLSTRCLVKPNHNKDSIDIQHPFGEIHTCSDQLRGLKVALNLPSHSHAVPLQNNPQTNLIDQAHPCLVVLAIFENYFNIKLQSIHLEIFSQLPIGAGLGSSATLASAMIGALAKYLNLPMSKNDHFSMVLRSEQIVHGRTSGLDAYMSVFQQPVQWINGQPDPFELNPSELSYLQSIPLTLIHTGIPAVGTAHCVRQISQTHPDQHPIWGTFRRLAQQFIRAIAAQSPLNELIQDNHQLLVSLGVVNQKAQRLISEIEDSGGVAKITGAGSIAEGGNGVLICLGLSQQRLRNIVRHYEGCQLIQPS